MIERHDDCCIVGVSALEHVLMTPTEGTQSVEGVAQTMDNGSQGKEVLLAYKKYKELLT